MKVEGDQSERGHITAHLSTERSENATREHNVGESTKDPLEAVFTHQSVMNFVDSKLGGRPGVQLNQPSVVGDSEEIREGSTCTFGLLRVRKMTDCITFGKPGSESNRYSSSQEIQDIPLLKINSTSSPQSRLLHKKASVEDFSQNRLSEFARFHSSKIQDDLLEELRKEHFNERLLDIDPLDLESKHKNLRDRLGSLPGDLLYSAGKTFASHRFNFETNSSSYTLNANVLEPRSPGFPEAKVNSTKERQSEEPQDAQNLIDTTIVKNDTLRAKKYGNLKLETIISEENSPEIGSSALFHHEEEMKLESPSYPRLRSSPEFTKHKSDIEKGQAIDKSPPNRLNSSEFDNKLRKKTNNNTNQNKLPPSFIRLSNEDLNCSEFSEMSEMKRSLLTPIANSPNRCAHSALKPKDNPIVESELQIKAKTPIEEKGKKCFENAKIGKIMAIFAIFIFLLEFINQKPFQ